MTTPPADPTMSTALSIVRFELLPDPAATEAVLEPLTPAETLLLVRTLARMVGEAISAHHTPAADDEHVQAWLWGQLGQMINQHQRQQPEGG